MGKTRLLCYFNLNFQKQAMMNNIKSLLFKSIEKNLEIETSNYGEVEINVEVSLDTVMEESLNRIA
jgi:hypothetical protein